MVVGPKDSLGWFRRRYNIYGDINALDASYIKRRTGRLTIGSSGF